MIWERLHNPDFIHFELEGVKKHAGANGFIMTPNSEFNRVQVDAVKNETESNRFVLTATKWITQMNVIFLNFAFLLFQMELLINLLL